MSPSRLEARHDGQVGFMKFVIAANSATIAVAVAPTPLTTPLSRQRRPRARSQCGTMPDCESVNAAKTLNAYSGNSAPVDPPKATMSNALRMPSSKMPLEKANRSPRKAS